MEIAIRLVLIVLGIIFLLLSAAGAILELAKKGRRANALSVDPLAGVTKLVEAITALWKILKDAPTWLALAGVGILLILLGALLPISLG